MALVPAVESNVFRIVIRNKTSKKMQDKTGFDAMTLRDRVADIFTIIAQDPATPFSEARVFYVFERIPSGLLEKWEPVVYLVDDFSKSLIRPPISAKDAEKPTGRTRVEGALNLAEVYLDAPYHSQAELLANTVIHELMHNKLNQGDAMHDRAGFTGDLGGFLQDRLPSNPNLRPTKGDIAAVAPRLSSVVPQDFGL